MEVNEQQVYEALGVEQSRQEPETTQATQQESVNQQQDQSSPPGEMSLEQRRENAARRRREETRAAIQEAVEVERTHARRDVEQVLRDAGLKNPTDGTPITNLEQYRAWKQARQERPAPALQPNPAMEAQVEAELAQIRQLNPNIRTVGDLLTMPRAKVFYQMVKRGNSFVDAYKLAHYDQLTQQAAAAARQQAQNLARSKGHLIAATQRGRGGASVPVEEMNLFRAFNPQASETAIQTYYNKYQGGK